MFLWLEKVAKTFQCQFVIWGQRLILLLSLEEHSSIQISLKYPPCSNLCNTFIHYVASLKSKDFSQLFLHRYEKLHWGEANPLFCQQHLPIYCFFKKIIHWCILVHFVLSYVQVFIHWKLESMKEIEFMKVNDLQLYIWKVFTLSNNCALVFSYAKVTLLDLAVFFSKM